MPTAHDDTPPVLKKYRALVIKDKGLVQSLLWCKPDEKIRLRVHNAVMKVEPDLVLDPAYTRIIQNGDMALVDLDRAVQALLVAREAARTPQVVAAPDPTPQDVPSPTRPLLARLLCQS